MIRNEHNTCFVRSSRIRQDYATLWDHLRSYWNWAKLLESVWLIRTASAAEQIRDAAVNYVDQNDKIFAVDITGKDSAWRNLSDDISEWIKSNYKRFNFFRLRSLLLCPSSHSPASLASYIILEADREKGIQFPSRNPRKFPKIDKFRCGEWDSNPRTPS